MLVSYPAIFYYTPEESGYFVYFPDLEGAGTQGDTIEDALFMASDYLGILASDLVETQGRLPSKSSIKDLTIKDEFPFKDDPEFDGYYDEDKSFVSMVYVDLKDYFASQELVKKTLSIPKWSNDLGNKLNINFSKVLTDAIVSVANGK
ncbi:MULTISPECIES: type II toxin-antitoxin system HicB family antitoxin [Anaerococcus]|uniref:Type II toxin-antitoxin system HicB family antitoxin n=1 Tax=Anaerococcus kampingae TaxID=3115614 RepID=A0ABW9MCZ4_9FIRM|nr:type II toxin-antitoxin system HicB family antitoxin [Anaerococcus sp. Marseille-P3915]